MKVTQGNQSQLGTPGMRQRRKSQRIVGLQGLANLWNKRVESTKEEQCNNVFSAAYDEDKASDKRLARGDTGYGEPEKASKSAARALLARQWVKEQVKQLLEVINSIGTPNTTNTTVREVKFLTLF